MAKQNSTSKQENKTEVKAQPHINIKIIGIGGAGGNILTRMYKKKVEGVEFIALNTDMQALHYTRADKKMNIGLNVTRGLGAGMDPEIGRRAIEENMTEIEDLLKGADLIFITCGLGGGTGSGASPLVAEIAKKSGAIVVAVVTKPFFFEGGKRMEIANEAWNKLYNNVDALITIYNDRIFNLIDKNTSVLEAFKQIDEILRQGVQGIADLIYSPGLINLDFANLQTILTNTGEAIIGIGTASGKDRAIKAAKAAIASPLLNLAVDGATRILFNISGHRDLTLSEITDAARLITETADSGAKIIFGASYDDELKKGEVKITVIAGGFGKSRQLQEDLFIDSPIFSALAKKEEVEEQKMPVDESKNKKEAKVLVDDLSSSQEWNEQELEIPAFLKKNKNK